MVKDTRPQFTSNFDRLFEVAEIVAVLAAVVASYRGFVHIAILCMLAAVYVFLRRKLD